MKLLKKHKNFLITNKFTLCPLCNGKLRQTGALSLRNKYDAEHTCTCCGSVYNYYQNHFFSWNNLFNYEKVKHIGRNSFYIDKNYMRKLKINEIMKIK
jgi:uncharacterized protein with PIN domain